MKTHTPGPWRVCGKHTNGAVVVRGPEPTSEVAVALQNDSRFSAETNGRLIAAAPDLLRMLLCVQEVNPALPTGISEDIDAAIYKATGATP